ncbi:translocation protein Sec62-domain-containing protein [Cokeromyces recurvatus]|uniref:translocation protein Sec62-domain-containing protein n=1 Tax=Cokeromyces recurvatus TaxID=90255 RepID=UPI00222047C8|nr:translocation protein Sec62-domain-containing protein [Cokeromyces recurvatus]KAI7902306.1 translocation protein Sec62-domain-containing protein [Cokeromyces recurvatus]
MSHKHGPNCNHGPSQSTGPRTIQVNDANKAPAIYKDTANYLKNFKKSGLKARQGVFNGRRFEYFKGKRGIEAILKEDYAKVVKNEKTPTSRDEAFNVLNELGKFGFILRVDRGEPIGNKGSPRILQPNPVQEFKEDGYYMWIWEGSKVKLYLGAVGLVAIILAGVLFPLWPNFLRLGVWYLSVGVLCLIGLFFAIALIRLILYIITYPILPRGFWLFPNLFEDCGIIESFIPLYGFDPVKEKKPSKKAVTDSAATATEAPATDSVATTSAIESKKVE